MWHWGLGGGPCFRFVVGAVVEWYDLNAPCESGGVGDVVLVCSS